MARDPDAGLAASAYYPQLNPLIRHPGRKMPPGFDVLSSLWEDLDRWLESDHDGRRGRSTIRAHPHFTHIGWPLSQCLLRESDRRRLTDFFRSAGLEPGTEIEPAQLWALLRGWAHAGCGLTQHALRVIGSGRREIEEQLTAVLAREFEEWDGELRDAEGRRRGDIVLVLENAAGGRRVTVRLVPRRPEGFPEGPYERAPGSAVGLRAMSAGWFQPLEVAVSGRVLSLDPPFDRGAGVGAS